MPTWLSKGSPCASFQQSAAQSPVYEPIVAIEEGPESIGDEDLATLRRLETELPAETRGSEEECKENCQSLRRRRLEYSSISTEPVPCYRKIVVYTMVP